VLEIVFYICSFVHVVRAETVHRNWSIKCEDTRQTVEGLPSVVTLTLGKRDIIQMLLCVLMLTHAKVSYPLP
jgi:hypothetical protein